MKKKVIMMLLVSSMSVGAIFTGCSSKNTNIEGSYEGIAWNGQPKGVSLEDSIEKLIAKIDVDSKGVITNSEYDYLIKVNEEWVSRKDTSATVNVDFSIDPKAAVINGEEVTNGSTMFDVKTNNMMSFYSVAVNKDNTVAVMIAEPTTRYRFEAKLTSDFNFETPLGEIKIGETWIPSLREMPFGIVTVSEWSELNGKSLYDINPFTQVIYKRGDLEGMDNKATMKELLEAMGVIFIDGVPQPTEPKYGFHSLGGWKGNYESLAKELVGKNINEVKSLVDYSPERYAKAINKDNFFGVDVVSGSTKSIQNSIDTISGATVRMSRENEAYQRALVQAGVLKESDVVKGRFYN